MKLFQDRDLLVLEPVSDRVRVIARGVTVADSRDVLRLKEGGLAPVFYFPLSDVRRDLLVPTDHATSCALKGAANYYSLRLDGRTIENAVWQYSAPKPGVPELADRVAFYPHLIDEFRVGDAS